MCCALPDGEMRGREGSRDGWRAGPAAAHEAENRGHPVDRERTTAVAIGGHPLAHVPQIPQGHASPTLVLFTFLIATSIMLNCWMSWPFREKLDV